MSWDQRFSDPITGRKPLLTLRDAAVYITKLPKAEHEAKEWQAAMEALILVATLGGPTMFAHWRDEGIEPARRARVRPVTKGQALGTPEADAGSITM